MRTCGADMDKRREAMGSWLSMGAECPRQERWSLCTTGAAERWEARQSFRGLGGRC